MIEKRLHKSMKNRELIQLHSLEKSLVYFSTSLKANEITLEKMLKLDFIQKYEEDKKLIPAGNLIEIKFEDFESNALEMTQKIYETLSLPGFSEAEPAIRKYLDKKKGYKKNAYQYDPRTVELVEKNWGFALKQWGYQNAE